MNEKVSAAMPAVGKLMRGAHLELLKCACQCAPLIEASIPVLRRGPLLQTLLFAQRFPSTYIGNQFSKLLRLRRSFGII